MMKKTAVLLGAACSVALGANANTITVQTPSGAMSQGNPVDASATFQTFANTVTVTLSDLLVNPTTVAQLISDISFKLTSGQTTGSIANSSGTDRFVALDGTFSDVNPGTPRTPAWALDLSNPGTFHLTALGGGQPTGLIIGPPDAGGNYSNGNGSIDGNGPHNPFSALSATFILNIPGVNVDSSITDIQFSFGTTPGNDVPGLPPGTNVPDGGTTVLLLGAALSGLGLVRRKLS
jgi:hypothetical protein